MDAVSADRVGPRAALAHKPFRYLVSGYTVSALGDWLYNIVLLVYVFDRTHSAVWVACASIARIMPEIVLGPLAGAVSDRYGRIRVMLTADVCRSVLMFLLAITAAVDGQLQLILLLVFLSTAAGTPFLPSVSALTPTLVDESALVGANAAVSVVDYLALALGPAIGGLLVVLGEPELVFAVNGATFLVSAYFVLRLRSFVPASPRPRASLVEELAEGLRAVRRSPDAIVLLSLIPAISFVPGSGFVILVLVSDRFLGMGPEGATFLFAGIGAGGILASALVARVAGAKKLGVVLGGALCIFGSSFAALGALRSPALAFVLVAINGGAVIITEVLIITALQRVVPEEALARIFGILGTLIYVGALLGSLVAPVLVRTVGLGSALVVVGAVPLVAFALLSKGILATDHRAEGLPGPPPPSSGIAPQPPAPNRG